MRAPRPTLRWAPDLIVGMFLLKHGNQLDARRYLEQSAENPYNFGWYLAVARDTIRKLDETTKNTKPTKP